MPTTPTSRHGDPAHPGDPAPPGTAQPETAPPGTAPPETAPPGTAGAAAETAEADLPYRIVWNDAVDLRQLSWSIGVCVAVGLPAFLVSRAVLSGVLGRPALAGGYALLIGLVGCVLGAAVCTRLFPPKRVVTDDPETDRAAALAELERLGGTAEEFAALPRDVQDELRALDLAPATEARP